MEDLLQSQIQDSCRLALPNGLKDLMSDISREVLRAQPTDLLHFITDYLSAMLVTRENLNAAARVCDDVCENMHAAGLDDELREKGIDEKDIETIKELVVQHLEKKVDKPVKEGHLISKIIKDTAVDEDKIDHVVEAVRKAFMRYQAYNTTIYEMTPDSSMDEISRAAHHTIDLYRKTKPTDNEFNQAAEKLQAAYRAYGVRRQKETEMSKNEWVYAPEIIERAGLEDFKEIDATADLAKQHITFDAEEVADDDGYNADTESHFADSRSVATNASEKTEDIRVFPMRISTISSTSLAGSFIHLPKHKPYTIRDESIKEAVEPSSSPSLEEEEDEKQRQDHFNVDYTKEDSLEVTGQPFDFEPDDVESENSVEEEIEIDLPRHEPYTLHDESIKEAVEPSSSPDLEEDVKQRQGHFNVDYTKEDSMEVTDQLLDFEPDDVGSENSVEEGIEIGERKVVFVNSIDGLDSRTSKDEIED